MNRTARVIVIVATTCATAAARADKSNVTALRAVLASPGGELPFQIELVRDTADGPVTKAVVRNSLQRIELTNVTVTDDRMEIRFDHYSSVLSATSTDGGATWQGQWTRTGRGGKVTRLTFTAASDPGYRFKPQSESEDVAAGSNLAHRWRVVFAESGEAVGEFRRQPDGRVEGTFLTPGGDFGLLLGDFLNGCLRLSGFDGAHAFLIQAKLQADGTLAGDFWSGDSWHETWTAQPDEDAALPDGFTLARATTQADLAALRFRDLAGKEVSIAEVLGDGQAAILEVFGSWCPNCHDASHLLDDLQAKYASRGLRVIGIAWEYTGDYNADAKQIRRFIAHTGAKYPILYGGPVDREEIAKKLPFIDELKAYPTTIFLRKDGTVTAIHTGFSGPAAGKAHIELRAAFERTIERTLTSD